MFDTNQLVSRFTAFGVPMSTSSQLATTINGWVRNNGMEWTVDHLKLIKQTMISLEAGFPRGISEFVRTKDNLVCGPFKQLHLLVWKQKKAAFSALLSYTAFVSPSLTDKQRKKFLDAVEHPAPSQANPKTYWDDGILDASIPAVLPHPGRIEDWTGSPVKFQPTNNKRTCREYGNLLSSTEFWYLNQSVWKVAHPYKGRSTLSEYMRGLSRYHIMPSFSVKEEIPDFAGRISCIQEPGYKARFICNPARFFQLALKPLGDVLFRIASTLPWDCTFNQDRAIGPLQAHLANGRSVFCYDLSNATDTFPLDLQLSLIRSIVEKEGRRAPDTQGILKPRAKDLVSLFEHLSRCQYWMESEERFIRWTKGQPLGLYPSFAMFAITHGTLVHQLARQCGAYERSGSNQPFYILGDDIIILDDVLAEKYRAEMEILGVSLSVPKSLISSRLAEFTGRIVAPDLLYEPAKWRQVGPDNWVDFLRQTGPKGLELLPRHIRGVAQSFCSLPEPLGFGWNPEGVDVMTRLGNLFEHYCSDSTIDLVPMGVKEGVQLEEDILFRQKHRLTYLDSVAEPRRPPIRMPRQRNAKWVYGVLVNLHLQGNLPVNDLHYWIVDAHSRGAIDRDEVERMSKDLPRYLGRSTVDPGKGRISVLSRVKTLISMK